MSIDERIERVRQQIAQLETAKQQAIGYLQALLDMQAEQAKPEAKPE